MTLPTLTNNIVWYPIHMLITKPSFVWEDLSCSFTDLDYEHKDAYGVSINSSTGCNFSR